MSLAGHQCAVLILAVDGCKHKQSSIERFTVIWTGTYHATGTYNSKALA